MQIVRCCDGNQLVVAIWFAGANSNVIHGGLLVIGRLLEQGPATGGNPLSKHVKTTEIFLEIQQKHVRWVGPSHCLSRGRLRITRAHRGHTTLLAPLRAAAGT